MVMDPVLSPADEVVETADAVDVMCDVDVTVVVLPSSVLMTVPSDCDRRRPDQRGRECQTRCEHTLMAS